MADKEMVELCIQDGCPNAGRHPKHRWFFLSYENGKAVQEILNRYVNEELRSKQDHVSDELLWSTGDAEAARRELEKDINYITGLAKLFD